MAKQLKTLVGFLMCFEEVDRIDAVLEQHLTLSQLKMLFVLAQTVDPVPQKELAERLRLSEAATGRAVDALFGRDLVHRREDAADRRVKRVSLAPAGRAAIEQVERNERARLHEFVAALTAEDVARLGGALGPIVDRPELRAYCMKEEGNA